MLLWPGERPCLSCDRLEKVGLVFRLGAWFCECNRTVWRADWLLQLSYLFFD